MTLAERIKAFRAKNNLSQLKFGELCRLNRVYNNEIENGRKEPGDMAKLKIELVLNGERITDEELL